MNSETLKVGDTVNWRGAFGLHGPKPAAVTEIEVTRGALDGDIVEEVDWDEVYGRNLVVELDNGHWAYAEQIQPITEAQS